MDSNLVIKVKHGETLRRFSVYVDENGLLYLDMSALKVKICSLFKVAPAADLTLTYIDEDNDVVSLIDDDDLHEAIRQELNPLRINVISHSTRAKRSKFRLIRSSSTRGSPQLKHSFSPTDSEVAEKVLKIVQEPRSDAFSKLSHQLTMKATFLVLTKLVEYLSKLELSHLDSIIECQEGAVNGEKFACPVGSKMIENVDSFKEMGEAKTLSGVSMEEPMQDNLPKEKDTNMAASVDTSIPPSTYPLDSNFNVPEDSVASESSNLNMPFLPFSIYSFDVSSNDNQKKAQKHDDGHLIGNPSNSGMPASAANALMPDNLYPHCDPETSPCHNVEEPCDLTFDGDKISSDVVEQPSASGVASNLYEVQNHNFEPLQYDCVYPFRSNRYYSDGKGWVFHKGIRCDGCGVYPIVGTRFKSRVKENYDLCSVCFSDLGNDTEYIRLNHPVSHQSSWPTKKFNDPVWKYPRSELAYQSCIARGCNTWKYLQNLDSCLVKDVTVLDGTVMAPNVPFTKIWKMRNTGAIAWPIGTKLVWTGGYLFTDQLAVQIEIPTGGFPSGEELEIAVNLTTPEHSGQYVSYWRMQLPSGEKFGQHVSVFVKVDPSFKDAANTNMPSENHGSDGMKIFKVGIMKGYQPMAGQCKLASEVSKPKATIDEGQSMCQKLHFSPINGLTMSNGAPDGNAVKPRLVRIFEPKRSKKAALDIRILGEEKYKFENVKDQQAGRMAEWDSMLEELQEMGFGPRNC